MIVARTRVAATLLPHDHFHLDLLKRELVVDQIYQFKGALIRHVIAAQFNPSRFTSELGMRRQHFAIQQK